jgi:putative PIN family toxin of toxin-antitoxin system
VISFILASMRIVLDTDVVVAGMRSDRGASRQLLLAALDRRITLLASLPLALEYEAVLTRPEHLKEIGLSAEEVNEVLDALVAVVEPVALRFLWRPRLRDPADETVLETAGERWRRPPGYIQRAASRRGRDGIWDPRESARHGIAGASHEKK